MELVVSIISAFFIGFLISDRVSHDEILSAKTDLIKYKEQYKILKRRHDEIHEYLEMIQEDDVKMISKENYNWFILKKKDNCEEELEFYRNLMKYH